jgi:paraquat-inducible protein B
MSKQANPAVVGGFVLGAIALVVLGIIAFSSGALLRERINMVTYFPGSVQGLNVGAQVLFQGVPIGQVTDIGVDYLPQRESFRIPVHYEIWPKNVRVLGAIGRADARDVLQRLVDEKGLRARLESVSFITGQYLVALSLNPDLPERPYPPDPSGLIRVPAMPATRDRIEEMLLNLHLDGLVNTATDTLAAIEELVRSDSLASAIDNVDVTLAEVHDLLVTIDSSLQTLTEGADRTFAEYTNLAATLGNRFDTLADPLESASRNLASLTRNLDDQVSPLSTAAVSALNETSAAMRSLRSLTAEGSTTRYQLDRLLTEAGHAARSLRTLADYLERHPEALLQGKR